MYMDFKQKEHWNAHYRKKKYAILNYDGWLEKYLIQFPIGTNILDLGCGSGSDTEILLENGFKVCSADFSEEALSIMKTLVPEACCMKMDMTNPFPFDDNEFDIVVADLSLHYFEWNLTEKIVSEIKRVLKINGMLIARVNSDKDYSFGADNGEEIEPRFRLVNGRTKRFFGEEDIDKLFNMWEICCKTEKVTERYLKTKAYWEIAARNRKGGK